MSKKKSQRNKQVSTVHDVAPGTPVIGTLIKRDKKQNPCGMEGCRNLASYDFQLFHDIKHLPPLQTSSNLDEQAAQAMHRHTAQEQATVGPICHMRISYCPACAMSILTPEDRYGFESGYVLPDSEHIRVSFTRFGDLDTSRYALFPLNVPLGEIVKRLQAQDPTQDLILKPTT